MRQKLSKAFMSIPERVRIPIACVVLLGFSLVYPVSVRLAIVYGLKDVLNDFKASGGVDRE